MQAPNCTRNGKIVKKAMAAAISSFRPYFEGRTNAISAPEMWKIEFRGTTHVNEHIVSVAISTSPVIKIENCCVSHWPVVMDHWKK
jgi:hypothetical protein